jgi:hydroxymethylpyrimidine/phosphomethylpyrimidine kinase
MVDAQIGAVLDDLPVAAVKTGLLGTPEVVGVVAARARAGVLPRLVVDPVLVASTGRTLVTPETVESYRRELVPEALMVTPNLWEAAILTGEDPASARETSEMVELANELHRLGAAWVLVKGGHLPGVEEASAAPRSVVPDVLFDGERGVATVLEGPHVDTVNTHGTGCTLSAAIAALLARGAEPSRAALEAKTFVRRALDGAATWRLGKGHGPLDPFGWSERRPAATRAADATRAAEATYSAE